MTVTVRGPHTEAGADEPGDGPDTRASSASWRRAASREEP